MNEPNRKTCQICGRPILSKKGLIAHHGYRRPGEGWQTNSCEGARHEPLEVSNTLLAKHVENLAFSVERAEKRLDAEITEISYSYKERYRSAWEKPNMITVELTEANFEEKKAEHISQFRPAGLYSWEQVVKNEHTKRERALRDAVEYHVHQATRYAESMVALGQV